MGILKKIFGSYSDREIKRIMPIVDKINALESEISNLSDEGLKNKTKEFKDRIEKGETLDKLLPEAFAVVREAAKRTLNMRHFDVQLIGGIVLHQGRIAEMKTGEGKTLVATLPCYLNALSGKGVHVVTVNDYLAKRDSEQMGKIYRFLGLTVGLIVHDTEDRKKEYNADITYGTNNEFGFDYLRDNMVIYKERQVQREHNFAIVDEVDSILIDEARTPLIISGIGAESTKLYEIADRFAKSLKYIVIKEQDDKIINDDMLADYIVDEKANTATLTAEGIKKAEAAFGVENLSDPDNMTVSHHINQAIRANGIMRRDKDYVVKDGEVIIVDEFTGRLMLGRRYNDGLHQAIEAKENVKVAHESKTLATITFQNFFRLYSKISGMTGTALTEEEEFNSIYKLDVVVIPTNKPMVRKDHSDVVYKSVQGKYNAVINQIEECYKKGQPVLVGTITIEHSELLSSMLKKRGIKHEVLNAKFHEKEAEIISQAGKKGSVTIATNMAGRGTDIILGGNAEFMAKNEMRKLGYDEIMIDNCTSFAETVDEEILSARKVFSELIKKYKIQTDKDRQEVVASGGLFILGTERHESRRIDNQLRGRAGRQGDEGESRFFISLQDELMRLFGSERMETVVDKLGLAENEAIEHKMLSNAIENAQKKVEGRNFQIRKHVLQYDDVMNVQRNVIYSERQKVLDGENLVSSYKNMFELFLDDIINSYIGNSEFPDDWNFAGLIEYCESIFAEEGSISFPREMWETLTKEDVRDTISKLIYDRYDEKEATFGEEKMREIERIVLLQVVDKKWMDHIDNMDQLRQGIGLRAYGNRDPVIEYREEGYSMYDEMIGNVREDVVKFILNVQQKSSMERKEVSKVQATSLGNNGDAQSKSPVVKGKKVGRNDLCPCGSGKKYKKCCGQNEEE